MTAALLDAPPSKNGVYDGISDAVYHGDRNSLSSSGARRILDESPAKFRYEQDHPSAPKKIFDFGHAAHARVLGVGAELRAIPPKLLASNGAASTKDAKAFIAEARAAGAVPLKPEEYQQVVDMATALLEHPIARNLFTSEGQAEQSLYYDDPITGVRLRARPDWMTRPASRLLLVDYKTTASAEPEAFARHACSYGYHQQDPWYVDGVKAVGLDDDPAFVFVAQEKTAPYLVSVTQFDADSADLGRRRNRKAIDLYARCVANDHWPSWDRDVYPISLPKWAFTQEEYTA
ncbi:hypothetical protein CH276_22565 [Rhodococcus sp. 06-470-2]|uniref:PD-(D/E)XK nuclease-like domain-containing protein n=1 Tax=unclassified Rhodococcus (in: high G+C Gram-positive bacteria) TaxID=192944 RepID=UPI000B9A2C9F|nr:MULTISPECIES: PD-(D/E)XK nuclease-like domain-containing protein [unclassified Rhodococcus (in: high G+C Gram-positive bacteria)]OZC59234.1 hypothetical protein CH276_22565 [Rhodococcus sp. 06-470-2]OZE66821.1 hypothetical protein CH265_07890 [Rhodococcus sp. 05-2221-1B]